MDEYDDSHGKRRTGGVSLGIHAFQPPSEIHCPFLGRDIKTMAVAFGRDLGVVCTGSDKPGCVAANERGNPDRDKVLATGCPLEELWVSFEATLSRLDEARE